MKRKFVGNDNVNIKKVLEAKKKKKKKKQKT